MQGCGNSKKIILAQGQWPKCTCLKKILLDQKNKITVALIYLTGLKQYINSLENSMKQDISSLVNSVDPDQLASSVDPGSTLFSMQHVSS